MTKTLWKRAAPHLVRAFHGKPFAKDTIAHDRQVASLTLLPLIEPSLADMKGARFAFRRKRWGKARKDLETARNLLETTPAPEVTAEERERVMAVVAALAGVKKPSGRAQLTTRVEVAGACAGWDVKRIGGALDQLYWCGLLYIPTAPLRALTETPGSARMILDVDRAARLNLAP